MGKVSKKELMERWHTAEGSEKREAIIYALGQNISLDKLGFVESVHCRYDLRGIKFDIKTNLEHVSLRGIDFTYADFNHMMILHSEVEDVIFDECDATGVSQYNCNFRNCSFIKTNIQDAGFGIWGGIYENLVFEKAKLKHSRFYRPIFRQCQFLQCKLDGVDFGSSHLIDVKFTGKLDDVWFRGIDQEEQGLTFRTEEHGLNPMIVDFSEAELWDLALSNHCDLSKVILPKEGGYLLVRNWYNLVESLKQRVDEVFLDKDEREVAHILVEVYKVHAKEQEMMILNPKNIAHNQRDILGERSEAFARTWVSLIAEINKELLAKQ